VSDVVAPGGGLAPRPDVDPTIVAVVTAAATSILAGGAAPVAPTATSSWRFSGRWFAKHHVTRRDRPN
jgi:hypothetical protein